MTHRQRHLNLWMNTCASPVHKYLYVAVPKAACTKIKLTLHQIYHAAAYDRELASHVYGIYREDFETFGYDQDSWLFDY